MAVSTSSEKVTYDTLPVDAHGVALTSENVGYMTVSLIDAPQQFVVNRVWDSVAGSWVCWDTDGIDSGGSEYPGPGTWGVHTSWYRVETVKFTRV